MFRTRTRQRFFIFTIPALALALTWALRSACHAGSADGGFQKMFKVPPMNAIELPGAGGEDLPKTITFLKGQRACVIVTTKDDEGHETDELKLEVVDDATGKVVAGDEGFRDLVAVWYPSRDMTCTIRVSNQHVEPHSVFVSVK